MHHPGHEHLVAIAKWLQGFRHEQHILIMFYIWLVRSVNISNIQQQLLGPKSAGTKSKHNRELTTEVSPKVVNRQQRGKKSWSDKSSCN